MQVSFKMSSTLKNNQCLAYFDPDGVAHYVYLFFPTNINEYNQLKNFIIK